jgi:NADH-quinone oxidoreductase subunit C
MEVFRASPRQADLMIVAGRVSQKMAPVLRQIYDQMAEPKWVLAMGVCASSGGMFNNYAIVQGVDHVVPVDMYLPGCPPRPEMLIDAILKLHDQVQHASSAPTAPRDRGARGPTPSARCRPRHEGPAAVSDDRRPRAPRRRAARRAVAATPGPTEVRVGVRRGMFGVRAPATPAGTAASSRPSSPRRAQRPYGGWYDEVADAWRRPRRSTASSAWSIHRGEITFHVRARTCRRRQTAARRPALRFEFCSGVSGVHYPDDTGRELHAVYHLLSMTHNRRIRLEVTAPTPTRTSRASCDVYPTNDWHERETYDMFGIVFDGHPALTRILMPDDWPGHPQRKDYPLGGIPVEYKGGTIPPPDERRSYN